MKHISLIIPKRILGLILVAGLIVCSCKDDYSEDVITGCAVDRCNGYSAGCEGDC